MLSLLSRVCPGILRVKCLPVLQVLLIPNFGHLAEYISHLFFAGSLSCTTILNIKPHGTVVYSGAFC